MRRNSVLREDCAKCARPDSGAEFPITTPRGEPYSETMIPASPFSGRSSRTEIGSSALRAGIFFAPLTLGRGPATTIDVAVLNMGGRNGDRKTTPSSATKHSEGPGRMAIGFARPTFAVATSRPPARVTRHGRRGELFPSAKSRRRLNVERNTSTSKRPRSPGTCVRHNRQVAVTTMAHAASRTPSDFEE